MLSLTKKVLQTAGRRNFSIFTGSEQTVLAVGTASREVNGKKYDAVFAQKIQVDPQLKIFSVINSIGGENPVIATDVILVGSDGLNGSVVSVQPEADIKDSKAAFTGAPFKWTAGKVEQTSTVTGSKVTTTYDFDKKPSVSIVVEKDGKVVEKTTADVKVVNTSDFLPVKQQIEEDLAQQKARQFAEAKKN